MSSFSNEPTSQQELQLHIETKLIKPSSDTQSISLSTEELNLDTRHSYQSTDLNESSPYYVYCKTLMLPMENEKSIGKKYCGMKHYRFWTIIWRIWYGMRLLVVWDVVKFGLHSDRQQHVCMGRTDHTLCPSEGPASGLYLCVLRGDL